MSIHRYLTDEMLMLMEEAGANVTKLYMTRTLLPGAKVPWNFRSRERKLQGTFARGSESSKDGTFAQGSESYIIHTNRPPQLLYNML